MFLPLKVHHLNLTLECKMLPPFKVHDLNIVGDKLLWKKLETKTIKIWLY
jgi:hypothetical protein